MGLVSRGRFQIGGLGVVQFYHTGEGDASTSSLTEVIDASFGIFGRAWRSDLTLRTSRQCLGHGVFLRPSKLMS